MELSFGDVGLEDDSRSPSSSVLGEDLFRSDVEADESATTSTSFSCPPDGGLLEVCCLTGLLPSSLSCPPKGATPLHRSLRAVGGGGEGNCGASLVTK